jgi:glycosyltransferase involved in cell wall biosynthesis
VKVRLLHTIPSEGRTSSEVYANQLGRALRPLLDDSDVLRDWYPDDRLAAGAPRPVPAMLRYAQRYLAYQWSVRDGEGTIDHIVDHGYGHLAFSLDGRRTVVTVHDTILLKLAAGELPGPRPRWTILGHRVSLRGIGRVARVLTSSEATRQDFLRFTGSDPARVVTVPLGISPYFQPGPDRGPDPDGVATRPLRILHVGHTGFYKNIEGILRAIPPISRTVGRPVVFVKAGTPFTAEQRQLIGELGIGTRVEHLGMVPEAQLPEVYREADLLLMPSWHEGFGLPALEAMACGTPVVVSDRGSLPEVVGEAGLIVNPQDDVELVYGVVRALTDGRLRAELRQRGLDRVRSFTWERTARQTLAQYRAVAQGAGA